MVQILNSRPYGKRSTKACNGQEVQHVLKPRVSRVQHQTLVSPHIILSIICSRIMQRCTCTWPGMLMQQQSFPTKLISPKTLIASKGRPVRIYLQELGIHLKENLYFFFLDELCFTLARLKNGHRKRKSRIACERHVLVGWAALYYI